MRRKIRPSWLLPSEMSMRDNRSSLQAVTRIVHTWRDPCNENQLDAIFIHNLFRQSTSPCFGHICSPSSGGIPRIGTCCAFYLTVCWPGWLQICPKHLEVDWRNNLPINSSSSWFSLHGSVEMHGQQNIQPGGIMTQTLK
jgi:hypothetical protein